MGSALRLHVPAQQAQLGFTELQDLPLFAPPQERTSTELIVAPAVALTKLPHITPATVSRVQVVEVLSPSQVRTFLDC